MQRLLLSLFLLPALISFQAPPPANAQLLAQVPAPGCTAPDPVCAVSARIFPISSFDPVGSAVLIEDGLLVTNRHVIADNERAQVFLADGSQRFADVIPTDYPGDLILLQVEGLTVETPITLGEVAPGDSVYPIGADIGRQAIRVYDAGPVKLTPPADKPLAQVHHTAPSQPGNSGGALVNSRGQLVAILTSGGEGRNEAIPASRLAELKARSGPQHLIRSAEIGDAYKRCTEALDNAGASRERLQQKNIDFLIERCVASNSRQLIDLAGQTFGRQGFTEPALEMFSLALDQDPNALNTRIAKVITLHTAGRYEEEIPLLEDLMRDLPTDVQVLRFAIQAGKWTGRDDLAQRAFDALVAAHPNLAPVAKRFMDAPPPPRRQ